MSGKELILTSSTALATISSVGKEDVPYEQRIKEAQELEAKLQHIQETVPTRVYNVCSSSAGAGSGDFHQYRMIRKTEQERLKKMDKDWELQQKSEDFERKRKQAEEEAEQRTDKRRAKRQKKKEKKKEKRAAADDEGDEDGSEEGAGLLLRERLAKARAIAKDNDAVDAAAENGNVELD